MNNREAKLLLQTRRPGGEDDARPDMAEALALAVSDPELKAWWEAEQAFDRKVAAKLGGVPVPGHLRAAILGERKVEPIMVRWHLPYWLAAAALFAILAVLSNFLPHPNAPVAAIATNDYKAAVFPYIADNNPALGMTSPDHEKVAKWLRERGAPTGGVPPSMDALPSVGCQTLSVQGHKVSLICFTLVGGRLAHLFIVDKKMLKDPPGNSPEFGQSGDWSMASWSDGKQSYVLATKAGPDTLKQLL